MKLEDFRSGMRVQYIGDLQSLIGKKGMVDSIDGTHVKVWFDGRIVASFIRPQHLRQLLEVGGVTTTRREVAIDTSTSENRGGMKFDGGKPRVELLLQGMPNVLLGVSEVLTFGANKYAAHSWQKVPEGVNRYEAAAMRHKLARMKGEELDSESKLHHIYHEICSLMFVAELLQKENA